MALISWKSYDDPASGNFSFQLDREANQFVIWKRSIRYWRSGVSDNGGSSRSEMPSAISYFLSNFTSTSVRNDSVPYITSSLYTNTRMVMSFAGQIQYLQLNTEKTWSVIWAQPRTRCSLYNACGNFGSCNSNNEVVCKCLPGFQPVSPEYWNSGDNSRGCARRSPLCSSSATSDTFLSLKMMKVANPDAQFKANSEEECKMECLNNCQCEAFSYEEAETTNGGESESATCWIWTDDLRDIQEEYDGGRDLHVRVSVSDTESAATACGTCGTNMIPYPLSTGPKCGDPAYLNFYCNLSSGQLNFKARGDTYRVTKINPGTHTFVIQTETADSCKSIKSNGNLLQLNQSSPFHVIRFCNVDLGNISSAISFTGGDEVEIGWDPPPEPTCFSSSDCKYWPNSSCSARIDGKKLCLCNAKFKWDGLKLKCTEAGHYSEKKDSSSIGKIPLSLIIAVALISLIALAVLSSTIVCICLQRRRMPKLRGPGYSIPVLEVETQECQRKIKSLRLHSTLHSPSMHRPHSPIDVLVDGESIDDMNCRHSIETAFELRNDDGRGRCLKILLPIICRPVGPLIYQTYITFSDHVPINLCRNLASVTLMLAYVGYGKRTPRQGIFFLPLVLCI
uniref:non-specific serine/threonine protein kinase n=1 Tax=Populus alba TaxID=43335 RepID=A0A4V6ABX6_POPAL|nr:G-type lectin S-receptor-like serine/threonine-protein kinase [Populus alba]